MGRQKQHQRVRLIPTDLGKSPEFPEALGLWLKSTPVCHSNEIRLSLPTTGCFLSYVTHLLEELSGKGTNMEQSNSHSVSSNSFYKVKTSTELPPSKSWIKSPFFTWHINCKWHTVMNYFGHNPGICWFCLGCLKVMQPIQKVSNLTNFLKEHVWNSLGTEMSRGSAFTYKIISKFNMLPIPSFQYHQFCLNSWHRSDLHAGSLLHLAWKDSQL